MATKKVAIVIVDRAWSELPGVKRFLEQRQKPRQGPPSGAHFITGPIADTSDLRGLWLGDVTTEALVRRDGQPFTMKFMIPWQYVLGLGEVDEAGPTPIGFKGDSETIVLGPQTEEQ
jgi:hypothetical protein